MDQKEIPMGALTPTQTRAVLAVEIHLRHEYILKSNAHDSNILSPPLMKILLRLYTLRGRGFPSPRAGEGRGGGDFHVSLCPNRAWGLVGVHPCLEHEAKAKVERNQEERRFLSSL